MTATTHEAIPRNTAGTWIIDPARSEIGFSVRHTMFGRVHGTFTAFSGRIIVGADPTDSKVFATVEMESVETHNERRDNHLRSADFLDVVTHPTMGFESTAVREADGRYIVDGLLTIKGHTHPISLGVEQRGFESDAQGSLRGKFAATSDLLRSDFGVDFNLVLEVGGVLIADRVDIHLDIEAVLLR